MKKKIIIAIDSFKGCLTSCQANQAAAEGILAKMPDAEVLQIPVSDGGEGWLEAFRAAWGGETIELTVRDPMMRFITARYLIKEDTAVIEIAKASGLTLLTPEERNPMRATSYGTGQLIVDAVRKGCRNIIVGLGGSATSDCGIGMIRAIIDSFAKNGTWDDVTQLDNVRFTIATDVTNPLCGANGAAHVYGPQKGATPDMVLSLDARARRFAEVSALHFGYDCQDMPGAGAAGGLGYAFLQYMGARRVEGRPDAEEASFVMDKDKAKCCPGIDLLLDAVHFGDMLQDASLVITGEGSADRQTLMGKLPFGILQRAKAHDVPVCLIAGRISDQQSLLDSGFSHVACINPAGIPLSEAMKPEVAKKNISTTVQIF